MTTGANFRVDGPAVISRFASSGAASFYGETQIGEVLVMGSSSLSFFNDATIENLHLTGTGSTFNMPGSTSEVSVTKSFIWDGHDCKLDGIIFLYYIVTNCAIFRFCWSKTYT
jgi:hypothetical protein